MKFVMRAQLILWSSLVCSAASPLQTERNLIDSLVAGYGTFAGHVVALQALEHIVEGKDLDLDTSSVSHLHLILPANGAWLKGPTMRAYALQALGNIGTVETMQYLKGLTPDALGPDKTGQLYPAAAIAFRTAALEQFQDAGEKTRYLEETASDSGNVPWFGPVRSWAVQALCDQGSFESLPVIEKTLRYLNQEKAGEERDFCVSRIRVLASNRNRELALASALDPSRGSRMLIWSVEGLIAMNTEAAAIEIDRFWSSTSGDIETDEDAAQAIRNAREIVRRYRVRRQLLETRQNSR